MCKVILNMPWIWVDNQAFHKFLEPCHFQFRNHFYYFFFLKILFMNSIISLKEGSCLCFIFSFLSSSFFSLYTLVCDPEMYLQFYLLNLNKLFIHKLCSHCPLLMICYIFRQQIFIYIVLLWIQNILICF